MVTGAGPVRGGAGGAGSADAAVVWELDPVSAAPAAARRLVSGQLDLWGTGDPAARGSVLLVVSELVTNAVVHAGTPLRLSGGDRDDVVVEVSDGSSAFPAGDPADTPGLGLRVVVEFADSLEWAATGTGKRVRAVVPVWVTDGSPDGRPAVRRPPGS